MSKGIIGKKLGMSQILESDRFIPVTLLEAGPCVVTAVRTEDKNGYGAIQLGYQQIDEKRVTRPVLGQFRKAGTSAHRYLAELRLENADQFKVGQEVRADIFAAGERADVTAVSKGKGFSGVMRRWGFKGQGASHGAHGVHRAPGSIGASATPSRVFPGRKMAGHLGNAQVTVRNLEIVRVDPERNLVAVKGAVPGPRGAMVMVRGSAPKTRKKKR